MIELMDTTSAKIAAEFVRHRRQNGAPAMGMVMTLVMVVDEDEAEEAMRAAQEASLAHPSRVLGVILGDGRGKAQVNAQVGVGHDWGGEAALIRLRGAVVKHPESVVLPLLLPDSPVVVWWACQPPADPAADPLGALASRRITDVYTTRVQGRRALLDQARHYSPGNTDLAWTRLTLWRGLLAAALDQHTDPVRSAVVTAVGNYPSADLMTAWLADRLKVDVQRVVSDGPGITEIRLVTDSGDVVIARPDGKQATLAMPGRPVRAAALRLRDLPEVLSEELRHLDVDDIYEASLARLLEDHEA